MALILADCPRCNAKRITFEITAVLYRGKEGWRTNYEMFSVCRHCGMSTVFLVEMREPKGLHFFPESSAIIPYKETINEFFNIKRFVSIRDNAIKPSPDHLPAEIQSAFIEASTCLAVECYNASATMFRLCVDIVTKPLLPELTEDPKTPPNSKTRRDLGLRLQWLFDNKVLPEALRDLAKCIREDANDGAHVGSLIQNDADDLYDFTFAILERLITEPKRLQLAKERRDSRRASSD